MINYIDKTAILGFNVKIWHFAVVLADVRIGSNVSIGSGTEIGRDSFIADGTRISAHVFLPAQSKVGANVFIGPGVIFTDDRYPRVGNADYKAEPPIIEDGASIGAGSVILPGVRIGKGAMVGAGSVVTRSIPPGITVYGPAALPRPVPSRDDTQPFPPLGCELEPLDPQFAGSIEPSKS
jgi:UDP-2-acetamido-3-amino-2,3-dideoxy-glucuronate N-acetyltransferase